MDIDRHCSGKACFALTFPYYLAGLTGSLAVTEKGVAGHILPDTTPSVPVTLSGAPSDPSTTLRAGGAKSKGLGLDAICDLAISELMRYFSGELQHFTVPLDLRGLGDFTRRVLLAAREIPYGQLRTYSWIANKIGKPGAARAVGNALGANTLPVFLPCHRIVCSDGSLGGFSSGVEWKRKLLALEREE